MTSAPFSIGDVQEFGFLLCCHLKFLTVALLAFESRPKKREATFA